MTASGKEADYERGLFKRSLFENYQHEHICKLACARSVAPQTDFEESAEMDQRTPLGICGYPSYLPPLN